VLPLGNAYDLEAISRVLPSNSLGSGSFEIDYERRPMPEQAVIRGKGLRQTYLIFGGPGAGKTYYFKYLLSRMLAHPDRPGCLLLDPKGSELTPWLEQQLANAPQEKALLIAVHHPPYSLDTVHGGYPDIEIAIDRAIHKTSRVPTAVLSGHVHSYQRFERDIGGKKVAYIIPGAGGYANTLKLMHKIEKSENGQNLPKGFQTVNHPDLKLMAYNDQLPGFLRVTSDHQRKNVTFEYFTIPFDGTPTTKLDDSVTISW